MCASGLLDGQIHHHSLPLCVSLTHTHSAIPKLWTMGNPNSIQQAILSPPEVWAKINEWMGFRHESSRWRPGVQPRALQELGYSPKHQKLPRMLISHLDSWCWQKNSKKFSDLQEFPQVPDELRIWFPLYNRHISLKKKKNEVYSFSTMMGSNTCNYKNKSGINVYCCHGCFQHLTMGFIHT